MVSHHNHNHKHTMEIHEDIVVKLNSIGSNRFQFTKETVIPYLIPTFFWLDVYSARYKIWILPWRVENFILVNPCSGVALVQTRLFLGNFADPYIVPWVKVPFRNLTLFNKQTTPDFTKNVIYNAQSLVISNTGQPYSIKFFGKNETLRQHTWLLDNFINVLSKLGTTLFYLYLIISAWKHSVSFHKLLDKILVEQEWKVSNNSFTTAKNPQCIAAVVGDDGFLVISALTVIHKLSTLKNMV